MPLYAQPEAIMAPQVANPIVSFLHEIAAEAAKNYQFETARKIRLAADSIAQPQASTTPTTDQAEGPSVDDVAELCQEFGFHPDSDDGISLSVLRDMITAAITRWPLPVARPITSDWRPIETAPRDGTWVLLTGGECESNEESDNRGRVVTAQWTTEYRSNAGDRLIADFGRWEFAYYDSGVYGEYENPTFWQPLPIPPITPNPHD
jgi:hypothetical protein